MNSATQDLYAGKRLLFMEGNELVPDAIRRAKAKGIYTISANWFPYETCEAKQVADEHVDINISDIDAMVELISRKKIDGIFIGWSDSHLSIYKTLCERTGLPCVGTEEQFRIYSQDKALFKECCKKHGVQLVPEYHLTSEMRVEDLAGIRYPVLLKPTNGSGGRGVTRCNNEEELKHTYHELEKKFGGVIIERCMDTAQEVFFYYVMQNGEYTLSASFSKHIVRNQQGFVGLPILHVYPSSVISEYRKTTEGKIKRMLAGTGLKNGIIMFQGFYEDGEFYFFESGLRMGGEQHYVFTERLNEISAMDMMLHFSIYGNMGEKRAADFLDPEFKKPCCNYYIPLKTGEIAAVEGLDAVREMPEVLQITVKPRIGQAVESNGALDQLYCRIHVMADTKEKLAEAVVKISSTLKIISTTGEEMQLERLTYERAAEMIFCS